MDDTERLNFALEELRIATQYLNACLQAVKDLSARAEQLLKTSHENPTDTSVGIDAFHTEFRSFMTQHLDILRAAAEGVVRKALEFVHDTADYYCPFITQGKVSQGEKQAIKQALTDLLSSTEELVTGKVNDKFVEKEQKGTQPG